MDVIRHDHEGVQPHGRKWSGIEAATFLDHPAQPVRFHFIADNGAEQASALGCTP
jgi:hypothetical protein